MTKRFALGAASCLSLAALGITFLGLAPSGAAARFPGAVRLAGPRPPAAPFRIVAPPARLSADMPLPALPRLAGFAVVDTRSAATLAGSDPDRQAPIASLTKLAAALVVIGTNPDWGGRVTIEGDDLREGSEPILIPGETVTREELFNASLIGSSNVATAALARSTGLTADQFVARMNHVAETLGLHQTRFMEPTGLDARNVSTAREVALLARAALGDLRIRRAVLSPSVALHPIPSKSPKSRVVRSTDLLVASSDLLASPYAFLGGKTGSLGADTGYHFAMMVEHTKLGGGIVVAVLGADTAYTRFEAARSIALWAFENYRWDSGLGTRD